MGKENLQYPVDNATVTLGIKSKSQLKSYLDNLYTQCIGIIGAELPCVRVLASSLANQSQCHQDQSHLEHHQIHDQIIPPLIQSTDSAHRYAAYVLSSCAE